MARRWHNHLNPDIDRKSWTKKEEESLFELHKIHGNKWTVITDSLPGRYRLSNAGPTTRSRIIFTQQSGEV
jgi:hypothetical protein